MVSKWRYTYVKTVGIQLFIGILIIWSFGSFGTKKSYTFHKGFNVYHLNQSFANIYIVQQEDKLLMIDSGSPDKGQKVETKLLDIGINPRDIDYLILTHAHPDHAGNAQYFKEKFGVRLVAGEGEKEIIRMQGEDANLCPKSFLGHIVKRTIAQKRYPSFIPDLNVEGSFNLEELGFNGTILPLPGHTKGSLVVSIGDAVFVGDIVRGKTLNKKKPTRHLFVCDPIQNLKNIERIAQLNDVKYWYPGHGGPIAHEEMEQFINKEKLK
ncbi:MAG: MBL fold metallo-hydrolase [Bacteroidota bacterium]